MGGGKIQGVAMIFVNAKLHSRQVNKTKWLKTLRKYITGCLNLFVFYFGDGCTVLVTQVRGDGLISLALKGIPKFATEWIQGHIERTQYLCVVDF